MCVVAEKTKVLALGKLHTTAVCTLGCVHMCVQEGKQTLTGLNLEITELQESGESAGHWGTAGGWCCLREDVGLKPKQAAPGVRATHSCWIRQ